MDRPPESDLYYEFFKAEHTTKYLESYIDNHCYAGQSLRSRIRFGFSVKTAKKRDGEWLITGDTAQYRSSKLIVASGLFSAPNIPKIPGDDIFQAPIIHQENFGRSSVLTLPQLQNVAVIGGGKSAADMVYACVKAGKSVSWIIRASGTGPGFFMPPKGKGPYNNAFEIGSTRVAGTLSPSLIGSETWWTRFLFGSRIGQKIVIAIWAGADKEVRDGANFGNRPNALPGFADLEPQSPLFWQNGIGGLLNRSDFWETIAPNVHVYLDDIVRLSSNQIHLQKGTEITTDVLLCGTGWNSASFNFFEPQELVRLGLPHNLTNEPPEQAKLWSQLEGKADRDIIECFPILASPPEHHHRAIQTTPYRLYNGIAPIEDNSIAFLGYFNVGNFFKGAECQAIWATAFLDEKFQLLSIESWRLKVAQHVVWCKRRYLSDGELGNFVLFESNAYTDGLLHEVGLSSHRKGWFRDYFRPGYAADLAGLRDEYIAKYQDGSTSVL